MTGPTLLVLAAGMGERFGGMKLIEPVGPDGEAILDYSLFDARCTGFSRFVLVVRRENEQHVRERIGAQTERHFGLEYIHQEVARIPRGFSVPHGRMKPWGTTHAVLTAAGTIHGPFAVINADDFYGKECFREMARHLQAGSAASATVGYTLRNTLSDFGPVARGVCHVNDAGYLERIVELRNIEREGGHARNRDDEGCELKLSGDEVTSMNMWGFTPYVFDLLDQEFQQFLEKHGKSLHEECFLSNAVNNLVQAKHLPVKVLRCAESWFGITYPDDHSRAVERIRHMVQTGVYPRKLR